MDNRLESIYDELKRTEDRLQELRRKGSYSASDVSEYQDALKKIDTARIEGKFLPAEAETTDILRGQELLYSMLHQNYKLVHSMLLCLATVGANEQKVQLLRKLEDVKDVLDDLRARNVVGESEELKVQHEALHDIEASLRSMDDTKLKEGQCEWAGQSYLHDLLEDCYDLAHELHDPASAGVDESLQQLVDELDELWTKIKEAQHKGVTPRELASFHAVLARIETHGRGGTFRVDTTSPQIPRGQAIIHSKMHRCYRILHQLDSTTEVATELTDLAGELECIKNELNTLYEKLKRRSECECETPSAGLVLEDNEKEQLQLLQHKLRELETRREPLTPAFAIQVKGEQGTEKQIPAGQAYLYNIMATCYKLSHKLTESLEP